MKRLMIALGVLSLLSIVVLVFWPTPGMSFSQNERDLSLTVSTWNRSNSAAEGDTCGQDLLIGGPEYSIYRQLVVRDESGTVIGVSPLTQGVVKEGDWGLRCDVDVTMTLPDRPYFTFEIAEDGFTITVSLEDLDDANWEIALQPDY